MRPFAALAILFALTASLAQGQLRTKGFRLEQSSWKDAEKLLTAEANAPRLRWFMGVSDDEDDLVAVFLKYLKLATGVHRTTRARPSQFTLGGHSDEF